ncbi:MAG: OB-fold nucleic acid binding domain-containing protein, partial [Gammaproteobacteria bacterium]
MTQPLDKIPLTSFHGVGPALAGKLSRLGISNAQDLLLHLPFRYEDRTRIDSIRKIGLGQQVQLQGTIVHVAIQFGRRRSLLCTIQDDSGIIGLRFFHFTAAQKNGLKEGSLLRCFGEVRRGRSGFELYHPEYRLVAEDEPLGEGLTPVYPLTEGVQQARLRKIIGQALGLLDKTVGLTELLPATLLHSYQLADLTEAIKLLHSPPPGTQADWTMERSNPGLKRLAFEELLAHRLCMRRIKLNSAAQRAPAFPAENQLAERFQRALPFTLTASQARVAGEIAADLARPTPMLRLVQGDVGS